MTYKCCCSSEQIKIHLQSVDRISKGIQDYVEGTRLKSYINHKALMGNILPAHFPWQSCARKSGFTQICLCPERTSDNFSAIWGTTATALWSVCTKQTFLHPSFLCAFFFCFESHVLNFENPGSEPFQHSWACSEEREYFVLENHTKSWRQQRRRMTACEHNSFCKWFLKTSSQKTSILMPFYVQRSVMSTCDTPPSVQTFKKGFSQSHVTCTLQLLSRYTLGCKLLREQQIGWLKSM